MRQRILHQVAMANPIPLKLTGVVQNWRVSKRDVLARVQLQCLSSERLVGNLRSFLDFQMISKLWLQRKCRTPKGCQAPLARLSGRTGIDSPQSRHREAQLFQMYQWRESWKLPRVDQVRQANP